MHNARVPRAKTVGSGVNNSISISMTFLAKEEDFKTSTLAVVAIFSSKSRFRSILRVLTSCS